MNKQFIQICQNNVNQTLDQLLPSQTIEPNELHHAMRYAVLNNGKRLRPILVYAIGQVINIDQNILNIIAATIELIHSYSLVHDDLPALDNDDLRRGNPTCHKAFSEAVAILVGDALQNLAFEALANLEAPNLNAEQKIAMIKALTKACNSTGMVGGQAIDIAATGKILNLQQLENMHRKKTGALFIACSEMVLAASHLTPIQQQAIIDYTAYLGLAFQIQDDILDVEGNTQTLGKQSGSDALHNKPTYPAMIGLQAAKQKAQATVTLAKAALTDLKQDYELLLGLADYIITRVH